MDIWIVEKIMLGIIIFSAYGLLFVLTVINKSYKLHLINL